MSLERSNFTNENLDLTRQDIMNFLDSDRDSKTKKTRKKPADLRAVLKNGGHKDAEIEKVVGDWDSYL